MTRLFPFALAASLFLMLFNGCSSAPKAAIERTAYGPEKLAELREMAAKDPPRAIETLESLLSRSPPDSELLPVIGDLDSMRSQLLAKLSADFFEARSRGDASLAYSLWRSLNATRIAEVARGGAATGTLPDIGFGSDLALGEAEASYKKGEALRSFIQLLSALEEYPALRSQAGLLGNWRERMQTEGDPDLAEYLDSQDGSGTPEQFARSTDPATLAKAFAGVATVRVDRGIKIEQGLGTPDRILGSGFYVDRRGYLVTNYHVIASEVDPTYEGYSRVTVKPSGESDLRLPARVLGWDPLLDLALLKVETNPGFVFSLTPATDLAQGTAIYAIGAPAGLESTISSGIVSAQGRRLLEWGESIQVDAPLNPGNSGGPLLDNRGRLGGVVFAGIAGFEGLKFAIPVPWLIADLPALTRGGRVAHPWLGYQLGDSSRGREGLEVYYRHPSAPATIVEGERILSIDGHALEKVTDLELILLGRSPGELVSLRIQGSSGERTVLRALGQRPEKPFETALASDTRERSMEALLGITVTKLRGSFLEAESYSIASIRPGSVADEAGLSENDPFSLFSFTVDKKERVAIFQIHVKKRKAGFLESLIQIPVDLAAPDFV